MKLGNYGRGLSLDISFWLQGLEDPTYSFPGIGPLSLELTQKFQALAIICLLAQGDIKQFREHLKRSAQARYIYLKRVHNEKVFDDHHFAAGRYEGLMSAIVAQNAEGINAIVSLTPKELQSSREYVDDYCFAQLTATVAVASFCGHTIDNDRQKQVLQEYGEYLAGEDDPRFDICRCFVEETPDDFDDAMEALVDHHEAAVHEQKLKGTLMEATPAALQKVSVTGLAMLAIARRKQWVSADQFKYCPDIARKI